MSAISSTTMLTRATTISFCLGIIICGIDADAGIGASASEDLFSVVVPGAGSETVGDGLETKSGSDFRSPAIRNTEKPGVTALKYSDMLSSPILTVGKTSQ